MNDTQHWPNAEKMPGQEQWAARCFTESCRCENLTMWVKDKDVGVLIEGSAHRVTDDVHDGCVVLAPDG